MGIGKGIAVAAAIIVVVGGGVVVYRTVGQGESGPGQSTAAAAQEPRPAMEPPAAVSTAVNLPAPSPVPSLTPPPAPRPATARPQPALGGVLGDIQSELISQKVRQARTDQRSMATALEAYFVDFYDYPPSDPPGATPFQITTPIAYITRNPPDPFSSTVSSSYRYYVSDDGHSWILISLGPDDSHDLTEETYKEAARQAGPTNWRALGQALAPYAYDPTNGTVSNGDIFRFKQ